MLESEVTMGSSERLRAVAIATGALRGGVAELVGWMGRLKSKALSMNHKSLGLTFFTCFCTLLLCLISCSTALCADARFSSGRSALAILFELENNLIYVRVSVNGSRPLSFTLDTGAGFGRPWK